MDELEEMIRTRLTEVDRELRDAEMTMVPSGAAVHVPPHFSPGQRRVLSVVLAELMAKTVKAQLQATREPEEPSGPDLHAIRARWGQGCRWTAGEFGAIAARYALDDFRALFRHIDRLELEIVDGTEP